jgi:hypothetical protein
MVGKYDPTKPLSFEHLYSQLKIIEFLGGVFGFLPSLRPTISEAKRSRLVYLMNEKLKRDFERESQQRDRERRDRIQAAKNEIEYLRQYGIQWNNVEEGPIYPGSGRPPKYVYHTLYSQAGKKSVSHLLHMTFLTGLCGSRCHP